MTAHRTDLVTGIVVAVIGAVYYSATFAIQETNNIVTPRTFPAIVGIALIALGLFLAGQAVYRTRRDAHAEAAGQSVRTSAGEVERGAASAGEEVAGGGGTSGSGEPGGSGVVLEAPPEPATRKVVLQFALFFVYLAILIPVGFLLSTAVFLMGLTSIYAPDKWIRNLIFSVVFAIVPYIAFVYGLAVYLPVGILG